MTEKTNIKAELKIILEAGGIVVAESVDPILWQKVLAALNVPFERAKTINSLHEDLGVNDIELHEGGAIEKFAKELGIPVKVIKGACAPSKESPFIHLDRHHWEAFKKNTPARGPKAVSAIILASTLLVLWKEKENLGDVTVKEAQKVLSTIGLRDNHPYRGLDNCEWLQLRGKNIIINPAQTSKAITMAKSYCTKEYGK
jgi:hypothetical protein